MKYRYLLFDADETLLDFKASQRRALEIVFQKLQVPFSQDLYSFYDTTNEALWHQLELGQITKEELIAKRFVVTCEYAGIDYPKDFVMEKTYQEELSNGHFLMKDAFKVCQRLSKDFDLYLVTNGLEKTQTKRFAQCGLQPFFKNMFISEKIGAPKPSGRYFKAVYEAIGSPDKKEILVIGDSMASDIRGGYEFGLDTCHFNHKRVKYLDIIPTYEIEKLTDLFDIVYA